MYHSVGFALPPPNLPFEKHRGPNPDIHWSTNVFLWEGLLTVVEGLKCWRILDRLDLSCVTLFQSFVTEAQLHFILLLFNIEHYRRPQFSKQSHQGIWMSKKCGTRTKHRKRYGNTGREDPNILTVSGENFTKTFQNLVVVVTVQDF